MKPKTLKCKEVFRHICDNLDADLDSPQCRGIKKHLDRCPSCTAYLDSLKKTVSLYREYPEPRLPKKTHHKLIATLKVRLPSLEAMK
jgi:predicted anti-sigma-YlaC factor YlaD